MPLELFEFVAVNAGCHVLNAGGRTVAIISPQGYVDWLLSSPDERGPLLTAVKKEPHLGYVLGLKFNLHFPGACERMAPIEMGVEGGGTRAFLVGDSRSADGRLEGRHRAVIGVDQTTGRYEWQVETTLRVVGDAPVSLKWLEYNNVYPGTAGRCMLFTPEKQYDRTLMVDRDGTVWHFPHQHQMHYTRKIQALDFGQGSMAGFFGERLNPVVIVDESALDPDWAICDMYYDLHCGARTPDPLPPGRDFVWRYRIKWLGEKESGLLMSRARYVPVTAEDYARHDMPRLTLGRNSFTDTVRIDEADDASGFPPDPPAKVWDRDEGPRGKGCLRLSSKEPAGQVWSAVPPTQIPARRKLRLVALAKTRNVVGKGLYLRLRYHTFVWRPEPHVEWVQNLESEPLSGTTPDWVRIAVPELTVPAGHFDYLVWIDLVLDGKGVGWLADLDVELETADEEVPVGPSLVPTGGGGTRA